MDWTKTAATLEDALNILTTLGRDGETEIPEGVQEKIEAIQDEIAAHW